MAQLNFQPYKDIFYAFDPDHDLWIITDTLNREGLVTFYSTNLYRIDQAIAHHYDKRAEQYLICF